MPMPRIVASLNRYTINPLVRRFAGNIPPFAILIHRGRSSGHEYRTPIMVFPDNGSYIIALTYGRGTDWERNVFHAGGCELIWRRARIRLVGPERIEPNEAARSLPHPVHHVLKLFGVTDFLRLHRISYD